MTDDAVEAAVESFLAAREEHPELTPEEFAAGHEAIAGRLLPALHGALRVLDAFAEDEPGPPAMVGGYRVVRELGRGGMGVVYEVERAGKAYALKQLHAPALWSPHGRARFLREADALQRLDHPGVVRVVDRGESAGAPFLVLERVSGRSLAGLGPLPWREATTLALQIAEALAAVHAAGLCHRDLKPENVLRRPDGSAVLVDFGLVQDAAAATLTRTGDLVGTPRYLSPEQAAGAAADARSDVFALGLLLAELLTGAPVRGDLDWPRLQQRALRGERPVLPRDLPRDVVRIVHQALARRPAHRCRDGAAIAAQLRAALRGEPAAARPPGPAVRAADWLAQHPRLAGAVSVAVLAVLLLSAFEMHRLGRASAFRRAEQAFAQGVAAFLQRDHPRAFTAAKEALAAMPQHGGAALLAEVVGDPPPAAVADADLRAALQFRAVGRWRDAAAAFEVASRTSTCALRHLLHAEAAGRAGSMPAAAAAYAAALQNLPDCVEILTALGQARLQANDAPGAADAFRRAAALEPRAWRHRYQLARALLAFDAATGLGEAAAVEAMLGADRGPGWCDVQNLRASLLDRLGRSAEAVPVLRVLCAHDERSSKFAFNLGYALDRLHEVAEARQWYERALELDPQNRHAALCLAWLLATAAPPTGDVERGEQRLVAALRADRGETAAVLTMVREFAMQTRRAGALAAELDRLAGDESLPEDRRALLRHTAAFVRNAVQSR